MKKIRPNQSNINIFQSLCINLTIFLDRLKEKRPRSPNIMLFTLEDLNDDEDDDLDDERKNERVKSSPGIIINWFN